MIPKKWLILTSFALLILVFSVASLFLPWWRIYTSRWNEIVRGDSIRIEYGLSGLISTRIITKPENQSTFLIISISELNASEQDKNALLSFFRKVWCLAAAGSGFNILIFAFICISSKQFFPLQKYAKYLTIIAGIIFLAASLYFASQIHIFISQLQNITPSQVYQLSGKQITAFFGKTNSLVYGPSFGWYLGFAEFLLSISLYSLMRKVERMP